MYKNSSGYSLIELLVVVIIISILTSISMRSLQDSVDNGRVSETKNELSELAEAIVGNPELASGGNRTDFGYVGDVGALPPNLDALVTNPGLGSWQGPYVKEKYLASVGGTPTAFKSDGWGQAYQYSGVTIASTGSGSTITQKIAESNADLLYNTATLFITDINHTPPGPVYNDSVAAIITYPNGSGGYASQTSNPTANGFVSFDSLPIGQHTLQVIIQQYNDTLKKIVTVYPKSGIHTDIHYYSDIWGDTTSSGGGGSGGTSGSEILRPEGSGTYSQLEDEGCGSNWQCVDETTSDGDGTYIEGDGNSYDSDLYATEDHSAGTGTIDSVVIHIIAKGPSGGKRARTYLRTNGSNYQGSDINLSPVSSYTEYTTSYVNNPATSSAWTWSEIDAVQIGVQIRREGRVTQVWLEVFYTT